MALKTRIIPVILHRGMQAFKGQQFRSWRPIGSVRQQVEIYEARGVDELVILDIGATPERRDPDFALLGDLTARCFMPVTAGGGYRAPEHFRCGLHAGADKICCAHGALWRQGLISEAAQKHGAQAVVVCLEHFQGRQVGWPHRQRHYLAEDIAETARRVVDLGAGELILNAVDRDGMMTGYDLRTIERVASAVSVPVVALGGAGEPLHFKQALDAGAHAVAASAIFAFTGYTPADIADYLAAEGFPVRRDRV